MACMLIQVVKLESDGVSNASGVTLRMTDGIEEIDLVN